MAFAFGGRSISLISSGNLSASQFRPVKNGTAAGTAAAQTSAGGVVIGILQNTPSTGGGDAAVVQIDGVAKVAVNSSNKGKFTRGTAVVASTKGGAIPSTGGVADFVFGRALSSMSSATTGLLSVQLTMEGYGSSQ